MTPTRPPFQATVRSGTVLHVTDSDTLRRAIVSVAFIHRGELDVRVKWIAPDGKRVGEASVALHQDRVLELDFGAGRVAELTVDQVDQVNAEISIPVQGWTTIEVIKTKRGAA